MVNKVILVGRLGTDPEVKYTQDGTPVASFSLATDEQWKDKDGKKVQKTEWHKVVAWRKLGEVCGEYLTKGKLIYIEGKIQTRQWEDKSGNKRYTTEVIAQIMKMLGGSSNEQPQHAAQSHSEDNGTAPIGADDDIPF